jgi:hypothetical protein
MMKGKTNLLWRIAIALVLTVTMGLTATVPVAATAGDVTVINMVSPTTDIPVWVKAGGSFVGNFTTTSTGNGTVQLAIVNATGTSWPVLAATNVTDIGNVTKTATVPAGTAEGVYNLTVQAKTETQAAYFNHTETGAVKIDNTPPSFSNIAVQDWDITSTPPYNITWIETEANQNASAYINIDLLKGGALVKNISNNTSQGNGTFEWTTGIPTVLGTDYKFKLTTTDKAGNTGSSNSSFFSIYAVDNRLPCVDIVTPPILESPYFVHIRGSNFPLNATATDPQSLIASVQFAYYNGTGWTNVGSAVTTPSPAPYYNTTFNTTAIPDGPIHVRATATNTVGATNSATNPRVVVDNTKPAVTMTLPANGTFVKPSFTMTGTATDAFGFGENGVKFQYQNASAPGWIDLCTFSEPSNSTTHTYTNTTVTSSNFTDGASIQLRVNATDKAGNSNSSSISNVTIDNIQPANLTVITPNGGEVWNIGATYNITWTTPTDTNLVTKPISIELYNDNSGTQYGLIAEDLAPAGPYVWTVPAVVPDGDYYLYITATDKAGNYAEAWSNCFTIWGVDSTAPSNVTLTAPANGAIVRRTIPVNATAVDNESGIQMVIFKYSVDNGTTWHEINEEVRSGPPWTTDWCTCSDVGTASNVKVEAIAVNGVGLKTTSSIVTITVDNRRPEVDIVTIPEYISLLPAIKGSANDTNSGIASVKLIIVQEHEYWDCHNSTWVRQYSFWNGTAWVQPEGFGPSSIAGSADVRPDAVAMFADSESDSDSGPGPEFPMVSATYNGTAHKWSYNSTAIPLSSCDDDISNYWEYHVHAIATDNAGNIKFAFNDNGNCGGGFYYRCYDYLELYSGWNFISIPRRPSPGSDTIGKLFAGHSVAEVWGYDPFTAPYWVEITTPTTPVEVLSGYWVYLNSGEYETVKFSYATNAKSVPPAKVLKGDAWNAIGPSGGWVWYYENECESYPVYSELKSIEGSWSNMVDWDAQDQCYEDIIIAPGYFKCLYCGKGYWLFVSNPNGDTLSSSINGEYGD